MIAFWEKNFLTEGITKFLEFLNFCIYELVKVFCGIFSELSNIQLFGEGVINDFTKRIYVIIGIYMLFRLAISLLNSIINPDNLLDKEKGMQKIIARSVISLSMLVLVPGIFDLALDKQNVIAEAVPRLVIGMKSADNLEGQGELLSSTAIKAFLKPNKQCYPYDDNSENVDYGHAQQEITEVSSIQDVLYLASRTCENNTFSNYKKQFAFEFNGIVSLVVGVFLVISLASYCVDIAIRSIKLGLLQLLAPIPIISYIDPKSEKDGAFSHWTKECISTYLEVFIKLTILYFVIAILTSIGSAGDTNTLIEVGDNAKDASAFAKVFLIIGAFFFMGKAAEFICNIIGVKAPKGGGGFLKGIAGLAGFASVAGGAVSSGINRYRAGRLADEARGIKPTNPLGLIANRGKNIAKGILGAGVGAFTAGSAVASAKGMSKFSAANKKIMDANAKNMTRAAHGGTALGDMFDATKVYFGASSNSDVIRYQLNKENDLMKFIKDKGNKKGKNLSLNFAGNANDDNYKRVTGISLNGTGGSLISGSLGDFITARNTAINELQAGVGNGKFNWGGLTNIDVNDANLDYFQDELTTLAGVSKIKEIMGGSNVDDKNEVTSVLKAASKTVDDLDIGKIKKGITEKENAIRSLNK